VRSRRLGLLGRAIPWLAIGAVSWVSSIPAASLPDLSRIPGGDKWLHGAVFFLLILSFRGWRGPGRELSEWLLPAVFILLAFAVADELHQSRVPGRVADLADGLADAGGIALGALLVWLNGRSRIR